MNLELLIIFIILSIVNVVVQTAKSIMTIKCGKVAAAFVNAFAYGFYTIVLVYTMCDLPLMWKAGIVALCNLIGVFVVKFAEEKLQKDKLWKIEVTIPNEEKDKMLNTCHALDLSYNYVDINKYLLFNFYCKTQKESALVRDLLKGFNAKYFVTESKGTLD